MAEETQGKTAADLLRAHWGNFCDCDWRDVPDDFAEAMAAAGLIHSRPVTADDLEDPFAHERGLYEGGYLWELTASGRAALSRVEGANG